MVSEVRRKEIIEKFADDVTAAADEQRPSSEEKRFRSHTA